MMTKSENEILIRIDEHVRTSLPRIEERLDKINDHLEDHSRRLIIIETQRNLSKKALAGYVSGTLGIIVALWKAFLGN